MPVMDGLAATVKIREKEQFKRSLTPIIAVTSQEFDDIFLQAGMDAFVEKPISAQSLLEAISAARLRVRNRSESADA